MDDLINNDKIKVKKEIKKDDISVKGSLKYKKLVKRARELKDGDERKKRNLKPQKQNNDEPLTFSLTW